VSEQGYKLLFQQRLRESREKRGISQQELSRLCGLNSNQISRYERGTQEPALFIMRCIAETLGVSLDYLVGITVEPGKEVVGRRRALERR
jgi:transcriptional regulator with XRE-family HTH domain